jgi:hypothetical protein
MDDGDASLVGPLLEQIDRLISAVFADGAYDGEPVYRSAAGHTPDAAVIIPPRSTTVPSAAADINPTQRDRHIQLIKQARPAHPADQAAWPAGMAAGG